MGAVLTGTWPPTDIVRLRALSDAVALREALAFGEPPTGALLEALGELRRLDRIAADRQTSPGHRLAALSALPDSEARRAHLVELAQEHEGEVAWEAAARLLARDPSRHEKLASSLLDREDADWGAWSYQQLRTCHDRAARMRLSRSPAIAFVMTSAEPAALDQGDVLVGDIVPEGVEFIRELHQHGWPSTSWNDSAIWSPHREKSWDDEVTS